jgi:hypothetical protein
MYRPLTLVLLFVSFVCSAQNKIVELEKRNGFKDLKLGMQIDSVKGAKLKKEFKEKEEFEAKLYTVENPLYATIGEVKINAIELKSYKNQVYEIHVVADKDPRLMKALESIYGIAEYDIKRETYFWKGQTLSLKFRSFSRNQLEMVYTSYPVLNQMKVDKGKKVQDIAEDF